MKSTEETSGKRGPGPLPESRVSSSFSLRARLWLVACGPGLGVLLLGFVYLQADPKGGWRDWITILALALLLALAFALVAWLERTITKPVDELIELSGRVAREENFALRVSMPAPEELAQLATAFNDLLEQIQLRDLELRRHRDHLGDLIAQRTAELLQLNHALYQARDKAEDASRAKSSFLANMSHELRTPLTAIIGYSEMLIEEAEAGGQPDSVPDLQRIRASGRHLLELINEVLDLSRIEAGRMTLQHTDFDLAALIREVSVAVLPLAEKNHNQLELDLPPAGLTVNSDQTKIRQTLLNLLSNACKFTQQGQVRLRLVVETTEGEVWAVVTVTDTGIGMKPEQLNRLFQAFTPADTAITRKYGGTGLGLTISKKFTEALGGQLTVTSEPTRGTTFVLRFPTRPLPVKPVPAPVPVLPASLANAPSVLVIDDDPHTRDLIARFLLKEGFTPQTAADGRQGLALAKQLRPALITLDVMMPDMDGWSVLSALKADAELATIPVVMVTVAEGRDQGFSLGAAEFLTKPVDFTRLAGLLRQHCPVPGERPILVVEDDEISSHLLRRNLEKEGYAVMVAPNGRVALDQIRMRLPAVILLDLLMPEMDGFEFAQAVRARRDMRDVPIIVLTAKDLTEEERQMLTGSVTTILQKQTVSPEDLQNELRAAFARHLPNVPKQP